MRVTKGQMIWIDTDITAYGPKPEKAVQRKILEVAKNGDFRISEGWFTIRRIIPEEQVLAGGAQ
jgi:hypothetical protein